MDLWRLFLHAQGLWDVKIPNLQQMVLYWVVLAETCSCLWLLCNSCLQADIASEKKTWSFISKALLQNAGSRLGQMCGTVIFSQGSVCSFMDRGFGLQLWILLLSLLNVVSCWFSGICNCPQSAFSCTVGIFWLHLLTSNCSRRPLGPLMLYSFLFFPT